MWLLLRSSPDMRPQVQNGVVYGKAGINVQSNAGEVPHPKGNHNVFSNRCAKKTKATKAVRQSRGIGLAGQASANAATDVATGTNRVVF